VRLRSLEARKQLYGQQSLFSAIAGVIDGKFFKVAREFPTTEPLETVFLSNSKNIMKFMDDLRQAARSP